MCELIYFSSINIFGVNSKLIKGQLQLCVGVCVYVCVCVCLCVLGLLREITYRCH